MRRLPRARTGAATFGGPAWRVFCLAAGLLALLTLHAWEIYVPVYQTFPPVDWLVDHPPLRQSTAYPSARSLALGLPALVPNVASVSQPQPIQVWFQPPEHFQRSFADVRDTSRVQLSLARVDPRVPATGAVRLDVIVFATADRAKSWLAATDREADLGDLTGRGPGLLMSTPGDPSPEWVFIPPGGNAPTGQAVVAGTEGALAFQLTATAQAQGSGAADPVLVSALAEQEARSAAQRWRAWARQRLPDAARS